MKTFRVSAALVFLAGGLVCVPAGAADVQTVHRLSANLAAEATLAAVTACAQQGYGVSAVLLDTHGTQQSTLRGDAASFFTLDISYDKAYTAIASRGDSGALVERQKAGTLAGVFGRQGGHIVIAQGAVVLTIGDEIVAALGVSGAPGGDKDEACARAGVQKIRDRLK